ncbi:hypothetical protein C0992_005416 [Termitomyces sp. T32_za158]|nr:hypothetical protein C0992_005416 [Termitomyces sp. T32_za158]
MKSAVTLLVEELSSIAPDVHNQMKTVVIPKRTMQATVQDADDIDDALPGFALTALPPNVEESVAKATSVDLVETYFKLLAPEDKHAILTVAQDSQAIWSIMLTVDNKSEVEAIVNSGSQIISMSANIANELAPTIHILQSPAYDILLGRPFDVLAWNLTHRTDLPERVPQAEACQGTHLYRHCSRLPPPWLLSYTIEEVISNDHGDEALILHITVTADLDPENTSLTNSALAYLYLTTSDNFDRYSSDDTYLTTLPDSSCPAALGLTKARNCTSNFSNNLSAYVTAPKWKGVQVKKKYKPVALKTKPVASSVSEDFRIKRKIIGNPLANMPPLS